MSMSQEEIEALMNGLDITDDAQDEDSSDISVNTEEIEALLTQNEYIEPKKEVKSSGIVNSEEIDALLKDIEATKDISNIVEEHIPQEVIVEKKSAPIPSFDSSSKDLDAEELAKSWTSQKIEEGIIPYPAEKDTKVVNQLSQVANDSEEKGLQIFDVLSLSLDNNAYLNKRLNEIQSFVASEEEMLKNLCNKFPNISLFNEHLSKTNEINSSLKEIKNTISQEDMKIFEAMELMQFNDINRQKLERVMSVIRKLSMYLNNIFEDDGSMKEVSIAKHIHGDEHDNLVGDDLDKLIAEFNK